MGTKTLTGIEIFAEGTWNDRTFSAADLDSMVTSFDALNLTGRIPLKCGHEGVDPREEETQFALGWVTKVYRRGKKLLADAEVADSTAKLIEDGHLRHVSVELLCDVQAGTRVLPFVLDGVALLGITPPAVGILAALTTAKATAVSKLAHSSRFTCSISPTFKRDDGTAKELAQLRQQIAADKVTAHRAMLTATIETAVATGAILPRFRETFMRTRQIANDSAVMCVTLAETVEFIRANASQNAKSDVTSFVADHSSVLATGEGDVDAAVLVEKYLETHPGTDYVVATRAVFKANPSAAQAYTASVMKKTTR